METIITIVDVEGRDVNTSRGPGRVFNVKGSDGRRYSTFDSKLAQIAVAGKGGAAQIEYDEEPWEKNGKSGMNYTLRGLTVLSVESSAQNISSPPEGLTEAPVVSQALSSGLPKDEQIARAVALKAAVDVISSGYQEGNIFKLADEMLAYLLKQRKVERNQTSDPGDAVEDAPDSDGILVKF